MKKNKLFLLTMLVILISVFLASCGKAEAEQYEKKSKKPSQEAVIVKTMPVNREDKINTIRVSGRIDALKDVNLSFNMSGKVEKVYYSESDEVRKGAVIAKLDQRNLKANELMLEAAYKKAEDDYSRAKKLKEKDLISEQNYQAVESAFFRAKANYLLNQNAMEDSEIKAPFSGTIASKNIEEHEMANAGMTAFTLIQMNELIVKVSVSSDKIGLVKKDTPVNISVSGYNGEVTGRVKKIHPSADKTTGKFTVEISIDNNDYSILPGMVAVCEIQTQKYENAITIPLRAIIIEEGEKVVYRYLNGQAKKTKVETVFIDNTKAVIGSGLAEEDVIIVDGQDYVEDGTPINPVPASQ